MSITALYRGRLVVSGYLLGMAVGWLSRFVLHGAMTTLLSSSSTYIANRVAAHRNY